MSEERFDGVLLGLAQQLDGGIAQLLDIFFSFLYRKTDFFTGAEESAARAMVLDRFNTFVKRANKAKQEQEKERQKREKDRQQREEERSEREHPTPGITEIIEDEPATTVAAAAAAAAATSAPAPPAPAASASAATTAAAASAATDTAKDAASTTAGSIEGGGVKTPSKDDADDSAKKIRKLEPVSFDSPSQDDSDGEDGSGKGKLFPNELNGANTSSYVWGQTLKDVEINIPLTKGFSPGTKFRARDCIVEITSTTIKASLKGSEPFLEGKLFKKIHPEESTWLLDNGTQLTIHLDKVNQMEWWGAVIEGDKEINTRKVQPENSKLSDLEGETRSMVEKMMIDNNRKIAGMPSLEEEKKMEMLENFKRQHPEMDFSNVKGM